MAGQRGAECLCSASSSVSGSKLGRFQSVNQAWVSSPFPKIPQCRFCHLDVESNEMLRVRSLHLLSGRGGTQHLRAVTLLEVKDGEGAPVLGPSPSSSCAQSRSIYGTPALGDSTTKATGHFPMALSKPKFLGK